MKCSELIGHREITQGELGLFTCIVEFEELGWELIDQ